MSKAKPQEKGKTEQGKVRALYDMIGERGLYVNTSHDVFSEQPEMVPLSLGAGYKVPLIQIDEDGNPKGRAYASPLLFSTLTSLLNHGTMLVTGAPGIGKTTGAEFAGHFFTGTPLDEIVASEIQGHPQLTEEKMVASYDIGKLVTTGERIVIPNRFLECPVKIVDEGNRTPADVLSIMMRLADTGKAVYGGKILTAKPGPLTVTANYADEGTFQFTPPFLDRFDVATMVTSPQPWDLSKIRSRGDEKLNGKLEKLLRIPNGLELDFDRIRKEIKDMPEESDSYADYEVSRVAEFGDFVYATLRFSEAGSDDLERATKGNAWCVNQDNAPAGHFGEGPHNQTINEASIRTAGAMSRYSKAFAWLNGDGGVTVNHLKTVLPYLLWHKVHPSQKALTENPVFHNDRIAFVKNLVGKIETEYNEFKGHSAQSESYVPALMVVQRGKIGDQELTEDQVRNVARNAILDLGKVDRPWAATLASHIASEYNARQARRA